MLEKWLNLSSKNLDEAQKPFEERIKNTKIIKRKAGEGVEDFTQMGGAYNLLGTGNVNSYNNFYKKFFDQSAKTQIDKITEYRNISRYPEISEVIEDAINECTQIDLNGDILKLQIVNQDLSSNENIVKNLMAEFENLFYKKINIHQKIEDLMYSYWVDGKVFWENIIDYEKPSLGIINIKKLPTETMDFSWNPITGEFNFFVQYLNKGAKFPNTFNDALKDSKNIISFHPKQISYIDYGQFGIGGKKDVIGFLEKVKTPYNQIKLLETSIIIYRLVRAPERLVFKIDTGQMPAERAMAFVERVKNSLQTKVFYDQSTGKMSNEPNVLALLENFFLPTGNGRGSDISSVGGNPSGFSELDDLYYFQRKLYRALKYPLSRIESIHEKSSKDVKYFSGQDEISRDELKWGIFLRKHQNKFCDAFLDLFLIHLKFIGLAKEYEITKDKLNIIMTTPNNFINQMLQSDINQKWENYNNTDKEEFSKYWRMKKFLQLTDEEIQDNIEGLKKDQELGLTTSEQGF